MIDKKFFGIIAAASMLTIYSATASFASITCQEATIDQAAVVEDDGDPTTSAYQIRATCPAGTWAGSVTFDVSAELGDSGYATVLTAISLGNPVKMQVAGASWHSLVERVYLSKTP